MTAMELEAKRANIIRMLFDTEDEELLTEVERFLSRDILSVKEDTYLYSPDALKKAVIESEEDISQGKVYTIEEMRALHPRL